MDSDSTMVIRLNGEPRETAAQSIIELLKELQVPHSGIAVAVNGRVIRREEHVTTMLSGGDDVEIIRAVQGG